MIPIGDPSFASCPSSSKNGARAVYPVACSQKRTSLSPMSRAPFAITTPAIWVLGSIFSGLWRVTVLVSETRYGFMSFLACPRNEQNVLARMRNAPPETDLQYFFAELHYGCSDTPVVETCTILEMPFDGLKKKCGFCKGSFGILHPRNGDFVCGKSSQKKEYHQVCTWRKRPKEYNFLPEEEATSVQRLLEDLGALCCAHCLLASSCIFYVCGSSLGFLFSTTSLCVNQ